MLLINKWRHSLSHYNIIIENLVKFLLPNPITVREVYEINFRDRISECLFPPRTFSIFKIFQTVLIRSHDNNVAFGDKDAA
jgi:hypothetical protein